MLDKLRDSDQLSLLELMYLFRRSSDDTRWLGSADSNEYLALITYLVQRDTPDSGSPVVT